MAAIVPVITQPNHNVMKVVWSSVTENDTFTAAEVGAKFTDRTVQVAGTFGSATVLLTGSLDGTNYWTLTIPAGNASFTALGGGVLQEVTNYLKPTHSGGTSESVTVTVLMTAGR